MTATLIAVTSVSCSHTHPLDQASRNAIYERIHTHYERTVLIKPAESDQPEFALAPLMMQEILPASEPAVTLTDVYVWQGRALWLGEPVDQVNYVWFHTPEDRASTIPQGIRITLDVDGVPMVWEILREPSGARVLFASQRLEAAAMSSFSQPCPGRHFWVERSVSETPDVVIARIIDDAAERMGPIVYLDAVSHDVGTLICRCMEVQAEQVVGMATYRLAALDQTTKRRLRQTGMARWLPGQPPDELESWFRVHQESEENQSSQ